MASVAVRAQTVPYLVTGGEGGHRVGERLFACSKGVSSPTRGWTPARRPAGSRGKVAAGERDADNR